MSSELVISAIAWAIVQICRTIPAIVWSVRCQPASPRYRCPALFPAKRREKGALKDRYCTSAFHP